MGLKCLFVIEEQLVLPYIEESISTILQQEAILLEKILKIACLVKIFSNNIPNFKSMHRPPLLLHSPLRTLSNIVYMSAPRYWETRHKLMTRIM